MRKKERKKMRKKEGGEEEGGEGRPSGGLPLGTAAVIFQDGHRWCGQALFMFPITCSSSTDSHSTPQRQSLQNKSVHRNVQPQPSPPRTPALLRCPRIPESPSLGIFCRQQREPTLYRKALSFSEYKAENTITFFCLPRSVSLQMKL